jgi:hypothetical protein
VQLVNIHSPLAAHQESLQSYTLQLSDVPSLNLCDPTSASNSPTSPCTSLSSFWSDSEPSPTQRRQYLDDVTSTSGPPSLPSPPVVPSIPQTVPPVRAHRSLEAPVPRRPSIASAPPAPDSSTPGDTAGRRAPKERRVTRPVQPLACFFCRGRKIACGPPAKDGSGDRTCEYVLALPKNPDVSCYPYCILFSYHKHPQQPFNTYCIHVHLSRLLCSVSPLPVAFHSILFVPVCLCADDSSIFFSFGMDRPCARRRLVCEYPVQSYRGRRSKETPVRPQRR